MSKFTPLDLYTGKPLGDDRQEPAGKFVPLDIATGKPIGEKPPIDKGSIEFVAQEFKAKNPNLYGMWGAVKDIVPFLKYLDPDERERFIKQTQQEQTRELLVGTAEAELALVAPSVGKAIGSVAGAAAERFAPKMYQALTKPRAIPGMAGKAPAVVDDVAPKPEVAPPVAGESQELPKYARSVNLERQQITDAAKQLEVDMAEKAGVKQVVSQQETIDKAMPIFEKMKSDPKFLEERVAKIKAGEKPTIEEELAHRVMNAKNFEAFKDAAKAVESGTITQEQFAAVESAAKKHFLEVTNPLASDAGRRLSMYNIEVSRNNAMKALGKLEKPLNSRQRKLLSEIDWEDPVSAKRFMDELPDPKLKDYFYEYWYNSVLSGPPTHIVNVVGNTLWQAFQLPHRALTAGIDRTISTFTGRGREVFLDEVVPMMAGYKTGFARGKELAKTMFKYDPAERARGLRGAVDAELVDTKWAADMGAAAGAFERSGNKFFYDVGKSLTIPGRGLRSMDVWAKSMAYDAQINALATRTGLQKGLKGDALRSHIKDFMKNPTEETKEAAISFANYSTFMDDPGWFSAGIQSMVSKTPFEVGRLVIPFVRTIGNLLKRGVEMTPGVGLTLARGQKPAEVIAKQIEGSVIGLITLYKAANGEITGGAPESPNEREAFFRQGKQPWSVKMGDKWYSYRRVEPFNTVIAFAANAWDAIKNAKDDDGAAEIFLKMAVEFKNNLIDSSYMQGVTQLLNRHGKLKDAPARVAAGFVPFSSFWRSINRSIETLTEGGAKVREGDGFLRAFSQVIPGMSSLSPARLNVWGKEIEIEGGVFRQWLPYKYSTETTDPVEIGLEKLGLYPSLPSKTFKDRMGKTQKFDDDVYRKMAIYYGSVLKDRFDKVMAKPHIQKAIDDPVKSKAVIKALQSLQRETSAAARAVAIREQSKKFKPLPIAIETEE